MFSIRIIALCDLVSWSPWFLSTLNSRRCGFTTAGASRPPPRPARLATVAPSTLQATIGLGANEPSSTIRQAAQDPMRLGTSSTWTPWQLGPWGPKSTCHLGAVLAMFPASLLPWFTFPVGGVWTLVPGFHGSRRHGRSWDPVALVHISLARLGFLAPCHSFHPGTLVPSCH